MAKKRLILVKDEQYQKATGLLKNAEIQTWNDAYWYFHGITAVVTFVGTGVLFAVLWLIL